jgi:hypothetical protein
MHQAEIYGRVRRAVLVEGRSQRPDSLPTREKKDHEIPVSCNLSRGNSQIEAKASGWRTA